MIRCSNSPVKIACAIAVLVAVAASAGAQTRGELMRLVGRTVPGTVVAVADGDTIRIRFDGSDTSVRVRLEGIDAPERGEPFSTQARNAARVMLSGKRVQAKAVDVDNYDRLVARVIVNGADSSVHLIESGLACHFTRFATDPGLANAQLNARRAGKGFWAANAGKPACVKFVDRPSPRGAR